MPVTGHWAGGGEGRGATIRRSRPRRGGLGLSGGRASGRPTYPWSFGPQASCGIVTVSTLYAVSALQFSGAFDDGSAASPGREREM